MPWSWRRECRPVGAWRARRERINGTDLDLYISMHGILGYVVDGQAREGLLTIAAVYKLTPHRLSLSPLLSSSPLHIFFQSFFHLSLTLLV